MCSHNRAIHPKVEDIKIIRNRGMGSNRAIPNRDMTNKVMPNSKTINNRAMDNHLPGKTCRPGNCP